MDIENLMITLKSKMENTLTAFEDDLLSVRTGRATPKFLDPIVVEAYGNRMHLNQLATITTPDARSIAVQVWDKSMIKAVEKSIVEANLGLNPNTDGQIIRLQLPILSEERRKEYVKLVHKYAEQNRISIRNVRREGMDNLKSMEKNSQITEDEFHTFSNNLQKLTEQFIEKIDNRVKEKEKEILSI